MNYYNFAKRVYHNPDIRFILMMTVAGQIIQLSCRYYLKKHPEMVEGISPEELTKLKFPSSKIIESIPSGGDGGFFNIRGKLIEFNFQNGDIDPDLLEMVKDA